jgi:AcrR family transcriptional regulator
VVTEAGIPMSSVYHYFGSKEGILLAVMERGAGRFFAELPDLTLRPPDPAPAQEHLARAVSAAIRTLERHQGFLRLLIVFAVQPPAVAEGEIQAVVRRLVPPNRTRPGCRPCRSRGPAGQPCSCTPRGPAGTLRRPAATAGASPSPPLRSGRPCCGGLVSR